MIQMDKSEIDDIVLVGGSTRTMKVKELLQEFFVGKSLRQTVNPDEGVAYGAAMLAKSLGRHSDGRNDICFADIAPYSLGVAILNNQMSKIITRGKELPYQFTKSYTTIEENQTTVEFPIYEGEHVQADKNHLLDTFRLSNIPIVRDSYGDRIPPSIQVTFELDSNRRLRVTAKDKSQSVEIKVTANKSISDEELQRMRQQMKELAKDAEELKQTVDAREQLNEYCFNMMRKVQQNQLKRKIDDSTKTAILKKFQDTMDRLADSLQCEKKVKYGELKTEVRQLIHDSDSENEK